ncbi:outer membrane protein [Salinarimonas chemoclinalis]|uniref:outer membrane protein n=1 Tax=Salinarimonas chemoclinalis TaxID=3241599 RepID=UPI00355779E2
MFARFGIVVAALLVTMGGALAADRAAEGQPPVAEASWTGLYAGAWIGGRTSRVGVTACPGGVVGQNCPEGFGLDGFVAGVNVGFDLQLDNGVVLGAFLVLPLTRDDEVVTTPLFEPFGLSWRVTPKFVGALAARVGYAFGDVLPYAVVGVSRAWVESQTLSFGLPLNQPVEVAHTGMVLGGGLEMRLTQNVSVDGRYLLGLLGSATYDFCGNPPCGSSYDSVSHNFLAGLNYRF